MPAVDVPMLDELQALEGGAYDFTPFVSVGTIAGHHTASEVAALICWKDFEHQAIEGAVGEQGATKLAADPLWVVDWAAFRLRWEDAKAKVKESDPTLFAEDEWQTLLHAMTQTPGSYTDKDEQGLYNRLIRAGVKVPLGAPPCPMPPDMDLSVFQGTDDLKKAAAGAMQDFANDASNALDTPAVWMGLAGLGLLAIIALRR